MGTKRVVIVLLGTVLGLALSALPSRADEELVGLKAAHRVIKSEAKAVLGFAYPTAKRVSSVEYDDGVRFEGGGYRLIYAINYVDSDGDDAYVSLKFDFDKRGKLTSISDKAHSSFFPPFLTAGLFLELMKTAIKNDPKLREDPAWQQLLRVNKAEEFLVGYVNLKNGN
jgi:hypothetical protein